MTNASDSVESVVSEGAAAEPEHRLHLGIRLQAVNQSDQPVFSNITAIQAASGLVFLDFGFLEPGAVPAVVRMAQGGNKPPEAIDGRLAVRVVLGLDAAFHLAQQLEQQLRVVRGQPLRPAAGT